MNLHSDPQLKELKAEPSHGEVQIIALSELHDESDRAGPALVNDANPLHQVKTTLQVCVGEIAMTVGQLLGAKEHQVLQLDKPVDQPIDLLLDGNIVARGQLVAVGEHFAVRITELPVALNL